MRLFFEACHFPRSTSAGSKDMDITDTYYSLLTIVITCFAANLNIIWTVAEPVSFYSFVNF